jgi:hypothetical protein
MMIRDQELAGLAMTLGRDAKIKITVGGDGSYCKPDGSHINIARMPSTPVGRMLMTGLVFHEIGHKNHTKGGKPGGLLGDMMNVIEDIRVDAETIKARPGTCFNLEAVTTHYVKKGSLEPKKLSHALLGKVMAYGFGKVLNQSAILPLETLCDTMMDDAFGQEFIDNVEAIIKDIPKLKSTKDTTEMAQKLIDLLIQQPPPPPLPPAPQLQQQQEKDDEKEEFQSQPQDGGQGSSGDSETEEEQQSQGGGDNNQQQNDQEEGDGGDQDPSPAQPNDQQHDQGEDKQASGSRGTGAGSGGGERPTPEEIEEMLKEKTGYGDLSELIQSELDDMAANIPDNVRAGIPSLPEIGRLKPQFGKLHEVEAISASSRMRAKMMGMLQSIKRQPESYGLSGKKLASGRLVRMATGDPRIFKKKIETVESNTAVTVMLDLSGSMDDKYEVANAAAFALHNTLFGLKGVSVCSLEFSGKCNRPEVNVLVDFSKKPLSENFNHHPFDGTPTDMAIWAARAMLLQRPEPRKIMLILTDGCPCNGFETAAATQRAMKEGIEIAAIGIMHGGVKNYWKNNCIINSIQELPAAMFGVMEELLTKH